MYNCELAAGLRKTKRIEMQDTDDNGKADWILDQISR